jgi:hypothetical protein
MLNKFRLIFIVLIILLSISSIQPTLALDRSRFFTGVMFFSGLGASFAGAITQGQANGIYDEYLHSAVQADMDKLINDYNQKRQQSIIASRVGIGLTIGAALISLFDIYNTIELSNQANNYLSSVNIYNNIASADLQKGNMKIAISDRF